MECLYVFSSIMFKLYWLIFWLTRSSLGYIARNLISHSNSKQQNRRNEEEVNWTAVAVNWLDGWQARASPPLLLWRHLHPSHSIPPQEIVCLALIN